MREIIYESVAQDWLSNEDVFRIVYRSKQSNLRSGLSGFLVYSQGRFLQLLEGDDVTVRKTFDVIARDLRHRDVRVLDERPTSERRFPDWHMRRIADANCEEARLDIARTLDGPIPPHIDAALQEFFGAVAAHVTRPRSVA